VIVFAVCIPEMRAHYAFEEPPEYGVPLGIFVAETPAQAKRDALRAWTQRSMGVYSDDWPALRVRKLGETDAYERGELPAESSWWLAWPAWPILEQEPA
jgi:hypothetical protein